MKSGGSAALYGFLYQLLAHLDWAVKLSVTQSGEDFNLLLELPEGSDAEVTLPGRRVIEQYKTRAGGTWSIRDLIEGGIADFVKTAAHGRYQGDEFRFVTDGRVEHQHTFIDFMSRVAARHHAGTALDSSHHRNYRGFERMTDAEFFDLILSQTMGKLAMDPQQKVELLTHVLSRTRFFGGVTEDGMRANVDTFLRRCLPDPRQAADTTRALLGRLLEDLAAGQVKANAGDYLQSHGLDIKRPNRLATLHRALGELLTRVTMRGSHKYRASHDVRTPPAWDWNKAPIVALSGHPGSGKSWQLMRLGHDLVQRGLACVYAPLKRDINTTLDTAAQDVWNTVLETPASATLSALKPALKANLYPVGGGPWLTVLIDGPIDDAGVDELVDITAKDPDIRFAITVSEALGKRLRLQHPTLVQIAPVANFHRDELIDYLEVHGVDWPRLPDDLFGLLGLPLLASLYVRTAHGPFTDAPHTEYELFEALWGRIAERAEGQFAAAHLRTLARALGREPTTEALPREQVLPDASQQELHALVRAGWLDVDRDSRVRFAHDRLLNWAQADAIADDISRSRLQSDQINAALHLPWTPNTRWGYLLMDVLWKLGVTPEGQAAAAEMVSGWTVKSTGLPDHVLFEQLLPTLGQRGVAILDAVLQRDDIRSEDPRLVGWARRVAKHSHASEQALQRVTRVRRWLESPSGVANRVGLAFVAAGGLGALADDVLRLHLKDVEALRQRRGTRDYDASFSALKVCVGERPQWLNDAIEGTDDPVTLGALTWQLLNLEGPGAQEIWERCRTHLAAHARPDHMRGTLGCIRRFRDASLIEFVRSGLGSSHDFDAAVAFSVLATLAPEEAFAVLESEGQSAYRYVRESWFKELHRRLPVQTADWLVDHFDDGLTFELYATIEASASERLDREFIDAFSRAVRARQLSDHAWLSRWVKVLQRMRRPAHLHALAGTDVEDILVAVAMRRIDPERTWSDHLQEDARAVLLAISGPGAVRLAREELKRVSGPAAHDSLQLAMLAPWPEAKQDLLGHLQIAQRTPDEQGKYSTRLAIRAFAAWGLHEDLATLMRNSPPHWVDEDDFRIRAGAPPLPAVLVDGIAERLVREGASQIDLIRELILATFARSDVLIEPVSQVLHANSKDAAIFASGARALLACTRVPESLAMGCRPWLKEEVTQNLAAELLLRAGTPACLRAAIEFGQALLEQKPWMTAKMASLIPEDSEVREAADQLASKAFRVSELGTDVFDRIAVRGSSAERSKLRQLAFPGRATATHIRRAAIHAWLAVNKEEAVNAAIWAAEQSGELDDFCALTVLREGTHEQCLRFCTLIATLDREALWYHAGRALRLRRPDEAIRLMGALEAGEDMGSRRLFATLSGWCGLQHLPTLEKRSQTEDSLGVLKAIERALVRIDQIQTLKEHLIALRDAGGVRRLAALHACLAMEHPHLMAKRDDELWIESALEPHSLEFRSYALDALEAACKAWSPKAS